MFSTLSIIRHLLLQRCFVFCFVWFAVLFCCSSLSVVCVTLGVVYAGQYSVQQIESTLYDAQRAHSNAHLSFRVDIQESFVRHVTLPVVQGYTTNSDPHECAHHVHNGVTQFPIAREDC